MKEPMRLRSGTGPARALMAGSVLPVPSASRQQALQFASVAVGMTASGAAAAATTTGATSLVKSLVLSVCLGAVGGGVMSLAVSETFSHFEKAQPVAGKPAPLAQRPVNQQGRAPSAPSPAPEPVASVAAALPAPAAAAAEPSAAALRGKNKATSADDRAAAVGAPGSDKLELGPSLFEEQKVIESARAAVAHGDAFAALSTLDSYDRTYARKQFGPEALALRIQALGMAGQLGLARTLAAEFEQKYPHHPLLSRVQAAVTH
jgi:hypothetical protein